MSRTNRRHTRQIERHRHNKGPEMFCRAADNELQQKAGEMASSLSRATIETGDVAAAGLLVTLAENACYEERPGADQRPFSIAEKWAREPQVAQLGVSPRVEGPSVARLELTDGTRKEPDAAAKEKDEIVDAEFEMVTESSVGV